MPSYAEDRAAIEQILTTYARACDRREFETVGECFTADAQAEYSGVRLARGAEHIVAHMAPLANLPVTQHVVGSVSVEVDGDTATVASYTVVHMVRTAGEGHEVVHRGLTYDDRFVRTPQGWRIADRVHRVLWSTTDPTVWPVPRFTAR
ncbi:nuclear transport factor 2 family protein [Phytohabitans kaempferiae]|uniref:Nuclear transport factor 2 family protein n=1 Tax=Phytohabitans kaempferiae TaxID=1620943 RepID=A0ABV6LZ37_9ACTN